MTASNPRGRYSEQDSDVDDRDPDNDVDIEHVTEPDDEMEEETLEDEDFDKDQVVVPSPKRSKVVSKTKFSGAHQYKTKFKPDWSKKWLFIVAVPNDPYYARCTICKRNISVCHQGIADIKVHLESQMHKKLAKLDDSQSRINFLPTSSPLNDKVCVSYYSATSFEPMI